MKNFNKNLNMNNVKNMNKNVQPSADFNWDEFENGASSNVSKNFNKNIMNNVNTAKAIDEKVINEIFDQIRSTRVESWCSIRCCTNVTFPDGKMHGRFSAAKSNFKLEGGKLILHTTCSDGEDLKIRVSYKAVKRMIRLAVRIWNAYVAFYQVLSSIKTDTRRSLKALVRSKEIEISKNF